MERIQQWVDKQPGINCDIEINVTVRDGKLKQRIFVFNHETFDGGFIESLDDLNGINFKERQRKKELSLFQQLKEKYGKEG